MAEPTFRQRRLGEALKLLRERSGLSEREASDWIDYNVPKLSRIENGQVPDIHALRTMLDVYGVIGDEVEPCLEMWKLAKEKGWWKQYRIEDQGSEVQEVDRRPDRHPAAQTETPCRRPPYLVPRDHH